MTSLLRRVRTTLSIRAHRKVRGMLDGEYTSVFHGRSLEFDDLRPYVAGDEIKDIDWKATARLNALQTRRYVASRKHTIVLVVDTGRNMAALAASGETKRDLAVLAAGTASYIATRHGDLVALVAGDADGTTFLKPESTLGHLERMLQVIHARTTLQSATSGLERQLSFVGRGFRRGRILIVVADDRELDAREQKLLRRLNVRHEILWMTIGDADLVRRSWVTSGMRDVESDVDLPEFVRNDPRVRAEFAASVAAREQRSEELFESLAISSKRVTSEADVVSGFFHLLESHRHARR